jgi:hypothetical protein
LKVIPINSYGMEKEEMKISAPDFRLASDLRATALHALSKTQVLTLRVACLVQLSAARSAEGSAKPDSNFFDGFSVHDNNPKTCRWKHS